mmetsp:Transcript_24891/g.38501  ORF Transcript_24891/g.38501 Transcript_24891/m.38501 type:complete len:279 (+) Transcript_24891:122-958(+)|eukprot:CAMPEP_0196806032 /NCGR_PEP_ID=MMETSP1362-20130617/5901_1 /TAXON_ID=163516 /ORGANISM="Leptocylindrus danicus, Strain CCMP1856" /LENGTH=278 /DNA_ID=CAMNT_0042179315 /DNA_START=63 /DNA_END=899 /DNA_ORIENTATION=+
MPTAYINTDVLSRDVAVGSMVDGTDDLPTAAAAATSGHTGSYRPSSQTDPHTCTQQDFETEQERIFMSDLNRMIDQYNAKNKQQQAGASTTCLPQKRTCSSLTVSHKRLKESSTVANNNAVEIEELLKAEEERHVRNNKWTNRMRDLMKYRDENGHCYVPCNRSSLGKWVSTQRYEYWKLNVGKASDITPQRIKILNHIDFVWDASGSRSKRNEEEWMRMFAKLKEYKEKHGNCRVPIMYNANPKLGIWVGTQRMKKNQSAWMRGKRRQKLEEIGFDW